MRFWSGWAVKRGGLGRGILSNSLAGALKIVEISEANEHRIMDLR